MSKVVLEKLGRSFAERRVFSGVEATLTQGDRLLVRGANGSGKSTLLKIMAGLLEPTAGRVRYEFDGVECNSHEARRKLGYLAPDLVLYDELSLLENLDFFAALRQLPTGPANRKLLDQVGLGNRLHDYFGTLSTGLKQRLKLAFALQNKPKVLFLDEPGANLDESGDALIAQAIDHVARQGIVVIATNAPEEFGYGNRTLELD